MPNSCVFCGTYCRLDGLPICHACRADLPWISHSCPVCALPVPTALSDGVCCADCQLRRPPFVAAVAPLKYVFPVDVAIKALKFRRKLHYAPALAAIVAGSIRNLPDDIDAILPVPLHYRRQALRGFNQAEELCKPLQRQMSVPLLRNIRRIRFTPFQSGLTATERKQNLRAAFAVRGAIDARHVLIVDDVITTGETCKRLAMVLLDAGVKKVSVLAVARAV